MTFISIFYVIYGLKVVRWRLPGNLPPDGRWNLGV